MNIKTKRQAGEILGREGLAVEIKKLAKAIVRGSYKNAVIKAGSIKVLAEACSYDEYWGTKALVGEQHQEELFENVIKQYQVGKNHEGRGE